MTILAVTVIFFIEVVEDVVVVLADGRHFELCGLMWDKVRVWMKLRRRILIVTNRRARELDGARA